MKSKVFAVLAILALGLWLTGLASASTLTADGDPGLGDSWYQNWNFNPDGTPSTMEIFITSTTPSFTFESLDHFGGGASGWTGTVMCDLYAMASGNDWYYNGSFRTTFNEDTWSDMTMVMLFWDDNVGGTLEDAIRCTLSWGIFGWHWTMTDISHDCNWRDYDFYRTCPVPVPPSALLMGSGLLGLVGLGWRRRRS